MNRLDATRYPIVYRCQGPCPLWTKCMGHEVLLDVDELARDWPRLFEAFGYLRLEDVDTQDGKDRIALAQAYADPSGAWGLAAEAVGAVGGTLPSYVELQRLLRARDVSALTLAHQAVGNVVRSLAAAMPWHMPACDAAHTRLLALASVERISLGVA